MTFKKVFLDPVGKFRYTSTVGTIVNRDRIGFSIKDFFGQIMEIEKERKIHTLSIVHNEIFTNEKRLQT